MNPPEWTEYLIPLNKNFKVIFYEQQWTLVIDWQFSLLCWQDQAQCRDSRSTISGRGGTGAYDYLGRPVLHNNSRRGRDRLLDRDEESRLRVESYVRNSNMSLVSIYRGKSRPDFSKYWNVSHHWHDPLHDNWIAKNLMLKSWCFN